MVKRYMPDGTVRAIWPKEGAAVLREGGYSPVRAGNIKTIEEGPKAGFFYADLSALAVQSRESRFLACTWPPRDEYAHANADEEAIVEREYVLGAGRANMDAGGQILPCISANMA